MEAFTAWPVSHGRPSAPPEVTGPVRAAYDEACAVLPISPNASAALARRLLQRLLVEFGSANPKDNLVKQIDAVRGSLPLYVAENLNDVRHIGNLAAHPTADIESGAILEVSTAEAEFTLSVIESLFQHYIVAATHATRAKASLAAKHAAAGKAPP